MKIRSKGMILGMPLLAVLLMTGLWAMSHSAVQAAPQATYTVTNTNDSGAGSLRQAVLDANANAGVDTVNFAPALSGQTIVLTSGVIAISEGVSINGSGLTVPVTISGNNNSQIFTITAVGVSLNNLRIIEGRNVGGNGGAIFLSGAANVVINNSVIADNFATYDGGAIFLSEASTMVINNSVIADNVADLYRGGAIRTEGTLNVLGTTFINNESGGDGGAIENDSGDVTITNSTFTRNSGFQIQYRTHLI